MTEGSDKRCNPTADDGIPVDDPIHQQSSRWTDDEFEAYMARELQKDPLAAEYPEIFAAAPKCLVQWRRRYRGNPNLWKRLFDKQRVLKEFIEAAPIMDAVQTFVQNNAPSVDSPDQRFTVVDLASGKGFLSMFLSELLPPSKVRRFVLMDKAWPMHGMTPQPHHISWEHIYGEVPANDNPVDDTSGNDRTAPQRYIETWPIPLTTSRQDLKHGNQRRNMEAKFFQNEGPVILLAVHLCGTLSLKAVQFFNDHPDTIRFFALKPCCLPGMIHAKRHEVFSFGPHHSFDSKLVCVQGKWNKNKWHGPNRQKLAGVFDVWAHNLFLGINDTNAEKAQVTIRVQHDGGYQNTFLFAERFPTTAAVWEKLDAQKSPMCVPIQTEMDY